MTRYSFVNWTDEIGNVVGTTPAIFLTISMDRTLTANYHEVVATHVLAILATTGGTTDPTPGSYIYDEGATARVTASPVSGYRFDHWTLDGVVHTENPINVLMNTDHTLNAVFVPISPTEHTLTISATAGGTTDPAPGVYAYTDGSVAQVIAYPQTGYIFNHWLLDGVVRSVNNPISVLMESDHTLTAVFITSPPVPRPLTKLYLAIGAAAVAGIAYLSQRKEKFK